MNTIKKPDNHWLPLNQKRKETIGASTSKALALGMRDIAWSLGEYALIQKCKRHRYERKTKDPGPF